MKLLHERYNAIQRLNDRDKEHTSNQLLERRSRTRWAPGHGQGDCVKIVTLTNARA
jgi:hypothetical protein